MLKNAINIPPLAKNQIETKLLDKAIIVNKFLQNAENVHEKDISIKTFQLTKLKRSLV